MYFRLRPGSAGQWFSRLDRPTAEIKQIASISGATITFTTPIYISYPVSHTAQLSYYGPAFVANAGVENLKIVGGDDGNLKFNWAAQSWAKNLESTVWYGPGVSMQSSFRVELREFYIHDAATVQPGGGAYGISLDFGTSEVLVEDGISVRANKVIVARCSGAGSVVGYNYMDMGYINPNGAWIESGINGSHMVGPHHMLFEGNYTFSGDSDNTHGSSIYHTFFRNYLAGIEGNFCRSAGRGYHRRCLPAIQRAQTRRWPDGLFLLDVIRWQSDGGCWKNEWMGLQVDLRRKSKRLAAWVGHELAG